MPVQTSFAWAFYFAQACPMIWENQNLTLHRQQWRNIQITKRNYETENSVIRALSFCVSIVWHNVQNLRLSSPRTNFGLFFVLLMSSTSQKLSMTKSYFNALSMTSSVSTYQFSQMTAMSSVNTLVISRMFMNYSLREKTWQPSTSQKHHSHWRTSRK